MTFARPIAAAVLGLALTWPALAPAQGLPVPYNPDGGGAKFDIAKIPPSSADLGDFPFLTLPDGYQFLNQPQARDLDQFPFWAGNGFHNVQGRLFVTYVRARSGKSYSPFELKQGVAAQLARLGAVKIADGKMPNGIAHSLPPDVAQSENVGLGDIYNNPVQTWVIRRPDRQVWVQFTTSTAMASWAIMETAPGQ